MSLMCFDLKKANCTCLFLLENQINISSRQPERKVVSGSNQIYFVFRKNVHVCIML